MMAQVIPPTGFIPDTLVAFSGATDDVRNITLPPAANVNLCKAGIWLFNITEPVQVLTLILNYVPAWIQVTGAATAQVISETNSNVDFFTTPNALLNYLVKGVNVYDATGSQISPINHEPWSINVNQSEINFVALLLVSGEVIASNESDINFLAYSELYEYYIALPTAPNDGVALQIGDLNLYTWHEANNEFGYHCYTICEGVDGNGNPINYKINFTNLRNA